MTVLLQRSRFLHVPKTGGTWVHRALQAGCPAGEHFVFEGSSHARFCEAPAQAKFTFAFVRHPLSWWQSFWRFHKGPARRYVVSHKVCRDCWSEDFSEFIDNVSRRWPGEYGRVVDYYLGQVGEAVDFVGRQENLVEDLLLALAIAQEPHDEQRIRAVAPTNVGDPELPADYTERTREAVMASEAAVMRRFGYGCEAEDPATVAAWLARIG